MYKKEWDNSMMEILSVLEKNSKCAAKKVCCLIVNTDLGNYNILSIGLNGTPSGQENCNCKWEKVTNTTKYYNLDIEWSQWYDKTTNTEVDKESHHKWSLVNEIHAEVNALAKCNQQGVSSVGCTAFISYSPCFNCSKMLVAFGIKRIVFREKYDDFDSSVKEFLERNNIEVIHFNNNGDK